MNITRLDIENDVNNQIVILSCITKSNPIVNGVESYHDKVNIIIIKNLTLGVIRIFYYSRKLALVNVHI